MAATTAIAAPASDDDDPLLPSLLTPYPYPPESLASTTLPSSFLPALKRAQTASQLEIRHLSASLAPEIDPWLSRAQALQADILRARDTAREIVAEAETVREERMREKDLGGKVGLLEGEVDFLGAVLGVLEQVRGAKGWLDEVQEAAVRGGLAAGVEGLRRAEEAIGSLEGLAVRGCLEVQLEVMRERLKEMVVEWWGRFVRVEAEERSVTISSSSAARWDELVPSAEGLGVLDSLVRGLGMDLERYVFRPRLLVDDEEHVFEAFVEGDTLSLSVREDNKGVDHIFADIRRMLEFLSNRLPPSIGTPLSRTLIPAVLARVEEMWLEPAVPADVEGLPAFQGLLCRVQDLGDYIDVIGWHGGKQLRDWVANAPRIWLTKRREAVLGDVRSLMFTGLRETKVVERVETQMVSGDDEVFAADDRVVGNEDGDEWDAAWNEESEGSVEAQPKAMPTQARVEHEDDEDVSAWDIEDAGPKENPDSTPSADDGEGDAWGWEEEAPKTSTVAPTGQLPPTMNGEQPPSKTRELTLREPFTITGIPDGLLTILYRLRTDARTLADTHNSLSPVAQALSTTLPTLALAVYRATAPIVYSPLPIGHMLMYNDALHLAARLREEVDDDNKKNRAADVQALEAFSTRAYATEMERQRTVLRDVLNAGESIANVGRQGSVGRRQAEGAVEGVVGYLRELAGRYAGVLGESARRQCLGALLSAVTGWMVEEIEEVGDIGEEDSRVLKGLMDRVAEWAGEVFGEDAGGVFVYCAGWMKFQYLGEVLEASLADIRFLWMEGELSLEFRAEEVIDLVEGLFADSDMRRRTVAEIRRSGKGR